MPLVSDIILNTTHNGQRVRINNSTALTVTIGSVTETWLTGTFMEVVKVSNNPEPITLVVDTGVTGNFFNGASLNYGEFARISLSDDNSWDVHIHKIISASPPSGPSSTLPVEIFVGTTSVGTTAGPASFWETMVNLNSVGGPPLITPPENVTYDDYGEIFTINSGGVYKITVNANFLARDFSGNTINWPKEEFTYGFELTGGGTLASSSPVVFSRALGDGANFYTGALQNTSAYAEFIVTVNDFDQLQLLAFAEGTSLTSVPANPNMRINATVIFTKLRDAIAF